MRELISLAQADLLIGAGAVLLSLVAALAGWRAGGRRGLIGLVVGPLLWAAWHAHLALTERFGLDSLALLLGEVVLFVVAGLALGALWRWVITASSARASVET